MADNPVTFPRRFFPARPAPQREIGAGLDLTLRLSKTAKAQQPCCEPDASWVGERYEHDWENLPPTYLGEDGEPVDWSLRPIHTLVMQMDASASGESVSKYFVFAAVTGACGEIEWTMDETTLPLTMYPIGTACYLLLQTARVYSDVIVTLTAKVDGVDLTPLVLAIGSS